MGAELTKWLVDSKIDELHKNMPWKDSKGDKEKQSDSLVDELGRRADDVFRPTEAEDGGEHEERGKETEAALKKSRKVAASLRSKYKVGEHKPKTEEEQREEKKKKREKLEESKNMRDKMKSKYQRG